ncbi:hypothetical protein IWQ61_007816 [Dispira simplex]|nr:hypothetical protein IWQ61_007816 [Dispira simplex]
MKRSNPTNGKSDPGSRTKEDRKKRQRKYIIVKQAQQERGRSQGESGGSQGRSSNHRFDIEPGVQGILVTCTRHKESRCIREVETMLESYIEILYPEVWEQAQQGTLPAITAPTSSEEKLPNDDNDIKGSDSENNESTKKPPTQLSIEDRVTRELALLKQPRSNRLVTPLHTMTACLVFFKISPHINPNVLVPHIVKDLAETKKRVTRFTNRLLPVAQTCYANPHDIIALAKTLLAPIFHQEASPASTFAIIPKIRNNQRVDRMSLIHTIAEVVGPNHTVDLENPRYFILVDVLKSICFMSVVQDYYRYRKFNLYTIGDSNTHSPASTQSPKKE